MPGAWCLDAGEAVNTSGASCQHTSSALHTPPPSQELRSQAAQWQRCNIRVPGFLTCTDGASEVPSCCSACEDGSSAGSPGAAAGSCSIQCACGSETPETQHCCLHRRQHTLATVPRPRVCMQCAPVHVPSCLQWHTCTMQARCSRQQCKRQGRHGRGGGAGARGHGAMLCLAAVEALLVACMMQA